MQSVHLVYLGLAAAAFLLLTLYPGGEGDGAPASPKAVSPFAREGQQMGSGPCEEGSEQQKAWMSRSARQVWHTLLRGFAARCGGPSIASLHANGQGGERG